MCCSFRLLNSESLLLIQNNLKFEKVFQLAIQTYFSPVYLYLLDTMYVWNTWGLKDGVRCMTFPEELIWHFTDVLCI